MHNREEILDFGAKNLSSAPKIHFQIFLFHLLRHGRSLLIQLPYITSTLTMNQMNIKLVPNPTAEPTTEESAVNVVFNLQTDDYPEESSWALIDYDAGTYIKSDGEGYPTYEGDKFEANTLYSEAFELKRCVNYVLMVFDVVWDGLSGIYTPGYFEVFVEGQRVMGSSDGVAFGSSDSVEIYVC